MYPKRETTETADATWNMGTATLQRMDRLLSLASAFSQAQRFGQWFFTLMELRRNIAPFIKQSDYDVLTTTISRLGEGWLLPDGSVHPEKLITTHRTLDEVHEKMLRLMHEKGLLMPKPDDPRFAIEG